jgi:hypothetical protein
MGFGPFSSESTTKQTTADNRIAASDQAVVYTKHAGKKGRVDSNNNNVTVGKGGVLNNTYTTVVKSDTDLNQIRDLYGDLNKKLGSLADQITNAQHEQNGDNFDHTVTDRAETQVEEGGKLAADTIQVSKPSGIAHLILWGLAAFALIALVKILRHKKGAHA